MDCTSWFPCSLTSCWVLLMSDIPKLEEENEVRLFDPGFLHTRSLQFGFLLKTTVPFGYPFSIAVFFWFWKLLSLLLA